MQARWRPLETGKIAAFQPKFAALRDDLMDFYIALQRHVYI